MAVPFPFTDRAATKRRPALVISRQAFNTAQRQLVLAMITSTTRGWPSDTPIADWRAAGLDLACRIRLKLFTLDQTLVIRRIGTLTAGDRAAVATTLGSVLALT